MSWTGAFDCLCSQFGTKFWQMMGRGTRLRPDLFGPGEHKSRFYVFDYCGNFEFFRHYVPRPEGRLADSLSKRLFTTRLELIGALDQDGADLELRKETAATLHARVASMNPNNFLVRPKRRIIEQYLEPAAWNHLDHDDLHTLATEVAGLPSESEAEDEDAKRFDMLLPRLQLALLRHESSSGRLRDTVVEIAAQLEEQHNIPLIHAQLPLIADLQGDDWWQDVTLAMLEDVRKKLRSLVRLIGKTHRKLLYTDFTDEIGDESIVDIPGITPQPPMDQFREKVRAFLRQHQDDLACH